MSGYEVVNGPVHFPDPFEFISGSQVRAACPAGKRVLGGGFFSSGVGIGSSRPSIDGTAWELAGQATILGGSVRAIAVCAAV